MLFLFIFCANYSISQSYSISGGIQMPLDYKFENTIEQNVFFRQYFDDFYIETNKLSISNSVQKYIPRPGFYLNVNHTVDLKSRLKITAGIGVNTLRFNYEIASELISEEIVSEIIFPITDPINNPGFSNCDLFLNSLTDIKQPIKGQEFTIYYLNIPLSVSYQVNDHIGVSLGTSLKTPINSTIYSESIRLNQEMVNGSTICEYELHENKDNSGNGFNDLQLDLSARMHFYLKDNLSLDLGGTMNLSNTFYTFEEENFLQVNRKYKPINASLGLTYYFGEKLKQEGKSSPLESQL